jgi:hypothetical protein
MRHAEPAMVRMYIKTVNWSLEKKNNRFMAKLEIKIKLPSPAHFTPTFARFIALARLSLSAESSFSWLLVVLSCSSSTMVNILKVSVKSFEYCLFQMY